MDLKELLRRTRDERLGLIEKSKSEVVSVAPEDQHSPTLLFTGRKVDSIAKEGDVVIPERSGASVYYVKPHQEKISAIINTAEATKSAVLEPVSSVLEKIVRRKGVEPEVFGDEGQKSVLDAEAQILELALEHGIKPLFYTPDGRPEDGVFVIPGKGVVFVEEYQKGDPSSLEDHTQENYAKLEEYEHVKALNPDSPLPTDENPQDHNWAIVVSNHDEKQDEATRTTSLEVRKQEIIKKLFKNDPNKIIRITAFLENTPIQAEQLAPAQNQPQIQPVETPVSQSADANSLPTFGGPSGQFVPTVANFTWASDANQQPQENYDVVSEAANIVSSEEETNGALPPAPDSASFSGFVAAKAPLSTITFADSSENNDQNS